jgi:CRISPR-associated protein Csd1
MLLQRLVEYADADPDRVPAYYEEKPVRWMIRLHADGSLAGTSLIPLRDESDAKGRRGLSKAIPAVTRSGTASKPFFAADQLKYVLGWVHPTELDKANLAERHHAAFRNRFDEWRSSGGDDPVLDAVRSFYAAGHADAIERPADEKEWASSDYVVFSVAGALAHERPAARSYWVELCKAAKMSDGATGLCLCCGQEGSLLDTIPQQLKSSLLPGAAQGQALVSMNSPSHGFDLVTGLTNTPICENCGNGAMAGMTALLSDQARTMGRSGQDAKTVWWVTGSEPVDWMANLGDKPDEKQVAQLVGSVSEGIERLVLDDDAAHFCSLTVAGSTARVIVRDWLDVPLSTVRRMVARWFSDHAIADPSDGSKLRHYSVGMMALATGRYLDTQSGGSYADFGKKGEQRPHDVYAGLLWAALRGERVPAPLLQHVITRVRSDGRLDGPRAALLRLCLVRHPSGGNMTAQLDPNATDSAYLCGRAFAVLDAMQQATEPRNRDERRNTTFADRYLAKAITNPAAAIVAGRRDAVGWVKKLRGVNPAAGVALERRLDDIVGQLDNIPMALMLPDQARFLLGLHHQRAADTAERKARAKALDSSES